MAEHVPSYHWTPKVPSRRDDWWRGAVIYQIYPRSFQDTNGDGVGDLLGIAQRLEHVASLGVDAIWISPFFKSPMKDFGYDVADYCDVAPMFGTLDDFDVLMAKAHALGIKVLIDFVPSHTSNEHHWFVESRSSRENPRADWYVWSDPKPDGCPPNNWLSVFGGSAWEWEPRRGQYYLHNFLREQPDLNFHNPEVIAALMEQASFWLERGVDGFRIDAIDYGAHDPELRDNPPRDAGGLDFLGGSGADQPFAMQYQQYNKSRPELVELFFKPLYKLTESFGGRLLLGEISGDHALIRAAEYSDGGGLDVAYTFDLLGAPLAASEIERVVTDLDRRIGQGWMCWSFSNHDVVRATTRLGGFYPPEPLKRLLPILLCSLKGTICLYQGEELGLTEAELAFDQLRDPFGINFYPQYKGRDGARTPMPWQHYATHGGFSGHDPWLPVPPEHVERAVDVQDRNPDSILNATRQFLEWRKTEPPLLKGSIRFHRSSDQVLTFERSIEDRSLLCFFNLGDEEQGVDVQTGLESAACPVAAGRIDEDGLKLPPFAAFFGRAN
ncbi:MAG: alpha-amylase family glycosyl hydrolase [Geminicoccaceae bacterium]